MSSLKYVGLKDVSLKDVSLKDVSLKDVSLKYVVVLVISRCLSTTPHPLEGQGSCILLVSYSMIIRKPGI